MNKTLRDSTRVKSQVNGQSSSVSALPYEPTNHVYHIAKDFIESCNLDVVGNVPASRVSSRSGYVQNPRHPTRTTVNEVCLDFLGNRCTRGSGCRFVHSEELQPPSYESLSKVYEPQRGHNSQVVSFIPNTIEIKNVHGETFPKIASRINTDVSAVPIRLPTTKSSSTNHSIPATPKHGLINLHRWSDHRLATNVSGRLKPREVCRKYLSNQCHRGDQCTRIHPILKDGKHQDRPSTAQDDGETTPRIPATVPTPSNLPGSIHICSQEYSTLTLSHDMGNSSNQRNARRGTSKSPGTKDLQSSKVSNDTALSETFTPVTRSPAPENSAPINNVKLPQLSRGSQCELSNDTVNVKYSDLCWDPGTGFWGWKDNNLDAWNQGAGASVDSTKYSSDSGSENPEAYTSSSDTSISEQPDSGGFNGVCWDWLGGICKRGDKCRFQHSWEAAGTSDVDDHSNLASGPEYPLSQEQKPSSTTKSQLKTPPTSWAMTILDHAQARFGPGFQVEEIKTGFETPWIVVGNISSSMSSADIDGILEPFGHVVSHAINSRSYATPSTAGVMSIRARFSTPTEALQASAALHGAHVLGNTLTARLSITSGVFKSVVFQNTTVRIEWEAPTLTAFGGYTTLSAAKRAVSHANGYVLRDCHINAHLWTDLPAVHNFTVRFLGLPLDTKDKDLEMFGNPVEVMWEEAKYNDLECATRAIRSRIGECGNLLTFDVTPFQRDGKIRAWANFSSPIHARIAYEKWDGRKPWFTGYTRIRVLPLQSISYALSPEDYDSIKDTMDAFSESTWKQGQGGSVSVTDRRAPNGSSDVGTATGKVFVKLLAQDTEVLGKIKAEFEKLRYGEVLRENGKVAWDGFFGTPASVRYLFGLQDPFPGIRISRDPMRRILKLFGTAKIRETVGQILLKKIADLRAQMVYTIPLTGRLIGIFSGADFMRLQSELGSENVQLDLWDRCLKVRGTNTTYQMVREAVRQAQERCDEGGIQRKDFVGSCPVCFDPATSPTTLACGHTWCKSCLSRYLVSAVDTRQFPLTCLGDEARCAERISLSTARQVLSASEFESVALVAYFTHVHARAKEFHFCPAPNCQQVYRTGPRETVVQCPQCLLRICAYCHVEYHDGVACPEHDEDDDEGGEHRKIGEREFKKWVGEHDVKKCPGCRTMIERAEGCHHVTCVRCQTHICWVCLQTFPKGDGIYAHMRRTHGGIGIEEFDM